MPYLFAFLFLLSTSFTAGAEKNSCNFDGKINSSADTLTAVKLNGNWKICREDKREYAFKKQGNSGSVSVRELRQSFLQKNILIVPEDVADSLVILAVKANGKTINVPGKNNYGGFAWTAKQPGRIFTREQEDGAWIEWKGVNFKEPTSPATEIWLLGIVLIILSLFLGFSKIAEDDIKSAFHAFFFLISFFILLAGLLLSVNQLFGLIPIFLTSNAGCSSLLSKLLIGANAIGMLIAVIFSLFKMMPYKTLATMAAIGLVKKRTRFTIVAAIVEIAAIIGLLTTSILAFLLYFGIAAVVFMAIYFSPTVWEKIAPGKIKVKGEKVKR